jgi:hypothetical protein
MCRKTKPIPEDIGYYLSYNPDTGKLIYIGKTHRGTPLESEAGSLNRGYITVKFKKSVYMAHRIAYFLHTGDQPCELDHLNRNKADNRWCNLRNTDHTGNMRNLPMLNTNKSGHTGVYFDKDCGKWRAQGSLNNKTVYIGLFDTIEEGVAARDDFNSVNKFHASHGMRGDLSAA